MELYLARICERADGTLYIERKRSTTTEESYVAISHVWGQPSTIQSRDIDGIGPVQLSPVKTDILSILRLQDVCGTKWFWLDLFCIDQRPDSPISISDQLTAIPIIYKSAEVVVVLVESPICTAWAAQVSRVLSEGIDDQEVFEMEEAHHTRKCPYAMIMDPWFDRLWTRQEGLYAMKLRFKILNPVTCARLSSTVSASDRWMRQGQTVHKRERVMDFVTDKLNYHNIKSGSTFATYLDLVYNRHVDVSSYGGVVGPHRDYSPLKEAWRSGRETTKRRDYVLAVFPDIKGYLAPQNAKKMTFQELLWDACTQVKQTAPNEGYYIIPKVPKSITTLKPENNNSPWLVDEPGNITEAYDSFSATRLERLPETLSRLDLDKTRLRVAKAAKVKSITVDRPSLPEIVKLLSTTSDLKTHLLLSSPLGPCTGSTQVIQSSKDLLQRHFAFQLARPAIESYFGPEEMKKRIPHGVVNIDKIQDLNDIFERELEEFLVCLMCGTTQRLASKMLQDTKLVMVSWGGEDPQDGGESLALINKESISESVELAVARNIFVGWTGLELLGREKKTGDEQPWCVVGRTMIPKSPPEVDDGVQAPDAKAAG